MEYQGKTITVIFSFCGPTPAPWAGNTLFLESSVNGAQQLPDPGTSGNDKLREVLSSQNADKSGTQEVNTATAVIDSHEKSKTLAEFMGQCSTEASADMMSFITDADLLLDAGQSVSNKLQSVQVETNRMLPGGHVVKSTQSAAVGLYFMSANGLCIAVDQPLMLSPEKLVGATFYPTAESLYDAGVRHWGHEDGSWNCVISYIHGNLVILNELARLKELGDEPEDKVNNLIW